jgi:hypothetical protein
MGRLTHGAGINWLATLDTSTIGVFHTLTLNLSGRIEDMPVQSVLI